MAATKLNYETLIHTYGEALVEKQVSLEERMAGLGNEDFHKRLVAARQGKNESGTVYGKNLLASAVDPVANGIRSFIEAAHSGKAGKRHSAVVFLEGMNPEVAALLALRVVLDGVMSKRVLQSVAVQIGSRIEVEHRFRKLQDTDEEAAKYVQRKAAKASSIRHSRGVLAVVMARSGTEWTPWTDTEKLHLGLKLIEIVMETVGIIEVIELTTAKNKTNKYLTVTEKTLTWINRQVSRCEMLTPQWLPTVLPPVDWTNTRDGGYHTHAIPQVPLIKTSRLTYLDELDNRADEMPLVFDAVNCLQRTAWAINRRVLDTVRALWDHSVSTAGLPDREDVRFVQCPKCHAPVPLGSDEHGRRNGWKHECFETDEQALKDWKRKAAITHEANISVRSKRVQIQKTLWVAEMFAEDDRIYFPYTLDFRGRIYAVPSFNPQGHDLMKGLLHFADGKPVGTGTGPGWLAIHGANVYGYDKASLEDRITWVEEHTEMICAVAADPLEHVNEWSAADKPWQFLAFCFEWAEYLEKGADFVSRLPVALDGSCSGIQHFSAMLRDPIGGAAVNLLPAERPSDIYGRVAEVVREKLRLDLCQGGDTAKMAQQFLDLEIDRKATKRQVMTLPYGSTRYSCRDYTEQWMREQRGDRLPWEGRQVFDASQYLSTHIWDSIGEVVIAARQAMDWLQGCAKVVAGEGLPVTWTTPVGFPVFQEYPNLEARRVKSKLGDAIIKLTLTEETKEIDRKRMAAAISPNFVHSMDASHLMMSVDYAVQNGITSFAMIHDSFGTHAADADLLGACLRQAFVDMYEEHDVLAEFRTAILAQVYDEEDRAKVPPIPKKGSLNLEKVKESDFFFA